MIVIDSREKKFDHIKSYFDKNGIEYEIKKLDVGDYMNTEHPNIIVDRKQNLDEVNNNLSRGKNNVSRFTKECRRAFEQKLEFIVLIEGNNYKSVEEVANWSSKYSAHTGRWIQKEMFRLFLAYNVRWMFCRKNETAKKILELLQYDK